MAKKGKKKKEFQGLKDIRTLWTFVPIEKWLELLKEIAPDHKWEQNSINTITGSCVKEDHEDRTPSFKLFFNAKHAKCFGCGYFLDDIVKLVSKLRNTTYSETLIFLHQRFDLGKLITEHENELVEYNKQQEMKKQAAEAMSSIVVEFLRDNPNHLQYLRPGVAYLTKGRGLPISALTGNLPVGLLGKPEHLKAYIDEEFHEAFDDYFTQVINRKGNIGSIVFHYNDSPSTISKFKIRRLDHNYVKSLTCNPEELSQEEAKKLSPSSDETEFIKDTYSKNSTGLFGLYRFKFHLGTPDANVYVTEGEFDVLSAMAGQIEHDTPDFIILGTSGTGNVDITPLAEYGIRVVWVIPDHPNKNGDNYAQEFMKKSDQYSKHNMKINIFNWPSKLKGNDLDELIQNHGYDVVREYIHTKRNTTFLEAVYWIVERSDKTIEQIKTKYSNKKDELDPDDKEYNRKLENINYSQTEEITELLKSQLKILPTTTDKLIFMDDYKDKEGIALAHDDEATKNVYNLNTYQGVKDRVRLTLQEYINPAFYKGDSDKKWRLALWSKIEERNFELSLQEKNLHQMFATYIKKTPENLLDNILGESPVLLENCPDPNDEENVLRFQKQKSANAHTILQDVLFEMAQDVPHEDDLQLCGQGVHFVLPDREMDIEDGIIYIVNGSKLFKGIWNYKSEYVEWERIENSTDGNIRFKLDKGEQWSFIRDISDLYQANTVDLNNLFEKMKIVVDGWKFENHEIHRLFLALNIMSYNIQSALGYVNLLYIIGDPESGKTTLVNGLLSGSNSSSMYGMVPILESGKLMTSPTEAALKRDGNRRTTPFIIDEAGTLDGHPDSPVEKRIRSIFQLYMNTPMGGAQANNASKDDQENTVNYVLHHPVIFASPSKTTEKMFLTRTFILYTIKEAGRLFPGTYLKEMFSEHELETLRRELTVALLPRLYELKRHTEVVKKKLHEDPFLKPYDRFLNSNISPLTIYDFIGGDSVWLATEIVKIHKDRLDELQDNSHASDAINEVLYAECINVMSDSGSSSYCSPRSLIYDNNWNVLNSQSKGVYYLPENNWIVVFWKEAKVKVLGRTKHAVFNESNLKEIASKNPYAIEMSDEQHEMIRNELQLWDMKSRNQYSVLDGDVIGVETNPAIVNKEKEDKKKNLKVYTNKGAGKGPTNNEDPADFV